MRAAVAGLLSFALAGTLSFAQAGDAEDTAREERISKAIAGSYWSAGAGTAVWRESAAPFPTTAKAITAPMSPAITARLNSPLPG